MFSDTKNKTVTTTTTMSNTNTTYDLSDTQKELLYKIQDYLIKKDYIGEVELPPPYHRVVHPLKKILRVLHNEYYNEKDKHDLNGLREFYMIVMTNVDKSSYYKKQYSDDHSWLNTDN